MPNTSTAQGAAKQDLIGLPPVSQDLKTVFLGRESKIAYIPVRKDKSRDLRSKLMVLLTEYEDQQFFLQKLTAAVPINQNHGLLKDILRIAGRTGELGVILPTDDREQEKELLRLCKDQYELWQFFTDLPVDDETWKDKLSHMMAQLATL